MTNEDNCVLTMFGECSYKETGCSDCKIIDKIGKALKNERPKGEWIMNKTSARGRNYTCAHCNKVSRNKFAYCPNCGADMRKENDNENVKT